MFEMECDNMLISEKRSFCALYAALGGREELAPRHPLRALADGGRVAAAHEQSVRRWGLEDGGDMRLLVGYSMQLRVGVGAAHVARDPKTALAHSELDVVAPVRSDVEAGGDKADAEANN